MTSTRSTKMRFARLSTTTKIYARDLPNWFSERNSAPHIAVSLDIFDTGIDMQYLSNSGFLETEKLFEAPLTKVSVHGLLGVLNATQAGEVVSMVERVNQYAEAG